jgi:hypothetical protein
MVSFLKRFRLFARIHAAQSAMKSVVSGLLIVSVLSACSSPPGANKGQRYRCEQGIEFTARFKDDSVTLDTTRGYELLFRGGPYARNTQNPHEYSNSSMQAEFNTGTGEAKAREAVLRYPWLPLVVRCIKD